MMRIFRIIAVFMLLLPLQAYGEVTGITLTDELQLKLADAFMAEGEYYRAVTEYKKMVVLFPASQRLDYAAFKIGTAYFRGDEFEAAARAFASLRESYPGSSLAPEATFREGLSFVRLNQLDKAENAFNLVVTAYPGSEFAGKSLLGKSFIEFDRNNMIASLSQLESYQAANSRDEMTGKIRTAIALLEHNRELPQKSLVTAGILSAIVPGSGHIYAEHYGDGITAFFLNALFITGTVAALNQENYAAAGLIGVIGLPFYVGNIYGAANGASKYNLGIRRDLRNRLAVMLDYKF